MLILFWIIFVFFILILAVISEYSIDKQDEEWMNELKESKQWKKK